MYSCDQRINLYLTSVICFFIETRTTNRSPKLTTDKPTNYSLFHYSTFSSLKFLQQVLNNMSSPPTIPLYTGRYPAPNGYPQINGTETAEPLDFRKVESHRRYVWAFHKIKSKARESSNITKTTCSRNKWLNLPIHKSIEIPLIILYIYYASLNQGKHTYVS